MRDRQQRLDHDALLQHRLELVVGEEDALHLPADERVHRHLGDGLRVREVEAREDVDHLVEHREAAAAEEVAPLPADEPERHRPRGPLGDEVAPPRG